jgi:hypothetical protein
MYHGGSRGKWYSRLKICQATLRPCSTVSNACSLVNGNSIRIGHKSRVCSKGRRASCSPCTDVSPDGGRARSRSRLAPECGEVISIMVTDVGAECACASEFERSKSHSGSASVELVGRLILLTTVAVTVVTEGTVVAQFGPGAPLPHRSNDVRRRPRS